MHVVKPLADHQLLLLLLQFGLLLVTARALGLVAQRLGLPSVVGELLAGFVLGPSLLGNIAPGISHTVFPQEANQVHLLEVVSWLGVIMLLILTGLETDVPLIARKARSAAAISLGGIAVPFASGLALGSILPKTFVAAPDKRLVFALFIGTAMSISAIPVIAKVLMEMNIIRRDIGQITLAAGMIDDTIGWILLSVVAGLASSGSVSVLTAGRSVLYVVLVLAVAFTLGRRLVSLVIRTLDNHVGGDGVLITALMAFALAFGSITQWLHLEAVLGAFIAGILVGQVKRFDERLRHIFEQVALAVFAPVFFAVSGLRVDVAELARPSVLGVGLLVLAIAIAGKFAGAYLGARASGIGHWESLSLGAGMNARGAMEIIVATIGLSLGILTPQMYSIILMVAIVTSLMAPPVLRWTLSRVTPSEEEQARLDQEERRRTSFVGNLKRVLVPVGLVAANGPGGGSAGGSANGAAAPDGAADGARDGAQDDAEDDAGDDAVTRFAGLLLADEDVEVTSLALRPDGGRVSSAATAGRAKAALEEAAVTDGRTIVRKTDGSASKVILGEAKRGYDLLVLAARERRSAGSRTLFDREVDDVIQESPCSLLVLSSPAAANGKGTLDVDRLAGGHILVPISGSESDRFAAEVAFSLAAGKGTTVDLVHVVSARQHALRIGGDEAVLHAVEIGEDILARMADMADSMDVPVTTDVLVADHSEWSIVERARARADLVVLATGRRPVTQRAFFGHRIDYVVEHAPCPVAIVSPR